MISSRRLKEIKGWAATISYTRSQDLRLIFEEMELLTKVARAAEKTLILDVNESGGDRSIIEDARKIKRLEEAVAAWKRAKD